MKKIKLNKLILLLIIIIPWVTPAEAHLSAARKPEESFLEIWLKNVETIPLSLEPGNEESIAEIFQRINSPDYRVTPLQLKKKAVELDFSILESNELSPARLKMVFDSLRDTRFFKVRDMKKERRLSWLYPDDGCFVRADLAARYLKEKFNVNSKKIFAFGDLISQTPNHPDGVVTWWYHVANLIQFENDVLVIDPAVNPYEPMSFNDWQAAIGGGSQKDIEYSICHNGTFDPDDSCKKTVPLQLDYAQNEQYRFLEKEYKRLIELKRDAESELGDFPPWKF